jgi:carbon storage regulator
MLVLSRRIGEAITIADSIRVTVLSASGGKVRLGINAPRSVVILRDELANPKANGLKSLTTKPAFLEAVCSH